MKKVAIFNSASSLGMPRDVYDQQAEALKTSLTERGMSVAIITVIPRSEIAVKFDAFVFLTRAVVCDAVALKGSFTNKVVVVLSGEVCPGDDCCGIVPIRNGDYRKTVDELEVCINAGPARLDFGFVCPDWAKPHWKPEECEIVPDVDGTFVVVDSSLSGTLIYVGKTRDECSGWLKGEGC